MEQDKMNDQEMLVGIEKEEDLSHVGEQHIIKGLIQFVFITLFIVLAFMISNMLQVSKTLPGEALHEERLMVAETLSVTPQAYRVSFSSTGVVQARADIAVVPQVGGRVVSVNENFFEGGDFEAGEALFEIDPVDYKLQIERLEAEVSQAQTAYTLEKAEADAAIAGWKQINGDKEVPSLVARKPQKAQALATLKAAKAQLKSAELDLERTKFSLPFSGRVLSSSLENGEYVSAGQSYGDVYDVSTLEVRTSLEDKKLEWLLGTKEPSISIQTTYLGKQKKYEGVLKRGVSSLDTQTRFASVNIGFAAMPEDIVPGVFVDLQIMGPVLQNVLVVPITALQKGSVIWAVKENDTLYKLDVSMVYADQDFVVLSGVERPVNIVVSKLPGGSNGAKIKVTNKQEDGE